MLSWVEHEKKFYDLGARRHNICHSSSNFKTYERIEKMDLLKFWAKHGKESVSQYLNHLCLVS